jgi:photosystem II stability/assembly factor-like uncharacterized protein/predicted esterase
VPARSLKGGWLAILAGLSACSGGPALAPDGGRLDRGALDGVGEGVRADLAPAPCVGDGKPGRYREQSLVSGGEERRYFLYVPSSYDCRKPAAAMFHFHGTVGSHPGEAVQPEETWTLEPSVVVAEQRGFILVRPRSRSRLEAGLRVWQWRNQGDGDLNAVFVKDLLAHLERRFNLDPKRRYATGFSNGTNLSMRFLRTGEVAFSGFGLVGGGIWGTNAADFKPQFAAASAPRLYAVTGYRDYQRDTLRALFAALAKAGYPADRIFERKVDAGHELYGWHFAEMFDWMDAGKRPPPGALASGWTREASFPGEEDLLALARSAAGELLVSGSDGALYRRAAGSWKALAPLQTAAGLRPALTDLCLGPSGQGLAVGEGELALSKDGGASFALAKPVPDFFGTALQGFPVSYLLGLACASSTVVGGGYWAGARSGDFGTSWSAQAFSYADGPALVAAVAQGATGTLVGAGYPGFVGRGNVGGTVQARPLPVQVGWLNDVASPAGGLFWVVGEAGTILHSSDDGQSWKAQASSTGEDLYAVHFHDAKLGLAVGAHGAAVLTSDGGASWSSVATGLDAYLGDALWLDAKSALVVGEAGTVLTFAR